MLDNRGGLLIRVRDGRVHRCRLGPGALALLLVALSINVTRHRARTKISLGAEADHTLNEAARVFGNCAEYVPIGLGTLAGLGQALGVI